MPLVGGFRQRQQRARVSDGQPLRGQLRADLLWQAEEPQQVGHRAAVFPDRGGDLLLGQPELVGEPLIAEALFHGIEVLALDVLDERELELLLRRVLRNVAHDDGHFEQTGPLRGAPPALAGDDAVAVRGRPHQNRLDDAAG